MVWNHYVESPYEERLRDPGLLFILEKKRLKVELIKAYKLLKEWVSTGSRLFSDMPSDIARSNGYTLEHRKFYMNMKRKLYFEGYRTQE